MTFAATYSELKTWQTGIGALLGFIALFLGALWKFHLDRVRDETLRQQEIESIAAALYGEILLLREEIAHVARSVTDRYIAIGTGSGRYLKFDQDFLMSLTLSEPQFYRTLAPKVGMLPADMLIAITKFHSDRQLVARWLPLFMEDPDRSFTYSPAYVLEPARSAVRDVEPLLRKIEKLLRLKDKAADSDLGRTESLIEMENDAAAEG